MEKQHRWLQSTIAASADAQVVMPWQRQHRQRPAALQTVAPVAKPAAIAAR